MIEKILSHRTGPLCRQLAAERASAVRKYLLNHGEVPAERVSLAGLTTETPAAKGARVELRLK